MSDLLGIGASGVSTYRSALGVIGENVVNADTKGYVRRDIATAQSTAATSTNPFYRNGVAAGGGVRATGLVRGTDAFRVADSRLTAADAARAELRLRWLEQAEGALPDGDDGIAAKLSGVFAAGSALATDPGGNLPRERFLSSIDDAATAIRSAAEGLGRVSDGIATEAGGLVDQVNSALAGLDKINNALRRAAPGSTAQAQLMDERDRMVDGLAEAIGITTSFDARGAVTVGVAGSSTQLLGPNGPALVGLAVATDGRIALSASRAGQDEVVQPTGGTLAGLVESASAVSGRRRQLDSAAEAFATQLNQWQANGTTPAGTAGTPLLSIAGGAASLTLATMAIGDVAAASADAENGNALALTDLRGSNGAEARVASIISGHAQMVAATRAEASAAGARRDSSAAARDEISGVDLDREAAELIRFQQAYDGSARVIQVARETLQSILQLF
ncbi:flagellar hook-associated protein FlgK [Sphingomonas sp. 1P06PA]|uniref:flagellar hook-associated protein FlgK n=1 Tax=Sphingomonas sp. 1P06PA TaxID=554121 RepID=UPI0039A56EAC